LFCAIKAKSATAEAAALKMQDSKLSPNKLFRRGILHTQTGVAFLQKWISFKYA